MARLTGGDAWPVAGSPRRGLWVVVLGWPAAPLPGPRKRSTWSRHSSASLRMRYVAESGNGIPKDSTHRSAPKSPAGPRATALHRTGVQFGPRGRRRVTWPVRAASPQPQRPGRAPEPVLCATVAAVRVRGHQIAELADHSQGRLEGNVLWWVPPERTWCLCSYVTHPPPPRKAEHARPHVLISNVAVSITPGCPNASPWTRP